jgi:hypothetical protein
MEIEALEKALRASWDENTCARGWKRKWTKERPSEGQCAVSSLIVHDYFGGKLVRNATVRHVWNILPGGKKCDLTRDQYPQQLLIEEDEILDRHKMIYGYRGKRMKVLERYELLKSRVDGYLSRGNISNL